MKRKIMAMMRKKLKQKAMKVLPAHTVVGLRRDWGVVQYIAQIASKLQEVVVGNKLE